MDKITQIAALSVLLLVAREDVRLAPDPQTKERIQKRTVDFRNELRALGAVA